MATDLGEPLLSLVATVAPRPDDRRALGRRSVDWLETLVGIKVGKYYGLIGTWKAAASFTASATAITDAAA